MKGQTKTFRRLLRKCVIDTSQISSKKTRRAIKSEKNLTRFIHRAYLEKGKDHVLELFSYIRFL